MTTISTKLVKDGNSAAVRLPKTVLLMSGLKSDVQMEVKRGQVILRPLGKSRGNWKKQIAHVIATNPSAIATDTELNDWDTTSNDGLNTRT